jgi:catechol 2,3-dioxygenase-like lactoylglutathione lyase family enzyme
VAPPGAGNAIALVPPSEGAFAARCAFATADIETARATLRVRGVDVDAQMASAGTPRSGLVSTAVSAEDPVPPQFLVRDPDGNRFLIVQGADRPGRGQAITTKEAPVGLSDCRVQPVLAVSDLDRARRFYEQHLRLVPGEEEDEAVRYPCADGTGIGVYLSPENAGKSPATLAGWFVNDLDQTMAELASRGVVFEQYDQPGLKTDEQGVFDAGRFRAAWIKDPDGNTIALTEVSD